jgi:hypothetical protein
MMPLQEIESACDAQPPTVSRHELEVFDLPLKRMFYPFGFPVEVRTNSTEVLELVEELWGMFEKQHDTDPIRTDVHMVEGSSTECPPTAVYRIMLPLIVAVADGDNYSIVDLERNKTQISISRATLGHKLYAKYFLLGASMCCVSTRYATPVHAGCVALSGRGVLLCGDSGAGKSTLSYACARAGWTYIADDGSFLINDRTDLRVTGECHKVRFRPTAAELFPEIKGLEITPRAAGKPSIELPTGPMSHIVCAQTTQVDFIVFLNRSFGGPPALVPYRKDDARHSMRQTLYGLPETQAMQYATIERLLALDVWELRYTDLDWAIERLQKLVREGC